MDQQSAGRWLMSLNMPIVNFQPWWIFVVRGALAIAFGLIAFSWPRVSAPSLIELFGVFAILDGIFMVVFARRTRSIEAVVCVSVGAVALLRLVVAETVIPYALALWAVTKGISAIRDATDLRNVFAGTWLLALAGCISLILAVQLIIDAHRPSVWSIWLIGTYALFTGTALILLGIRAQRFHRKRAKQLRAVA